MDWFKTVFVGLLSLLLFATNSETSASPVMQQEVASCQRELVSMPWSQQKAIRYIYYLYTHASCMEVVVDKSQILSQAVFRNAIHVPYSLFLVDDGKCLSRNNTFWKWHPVDYYVYTLHEILT